MIQFYSTQTPFPDWNSSMKFFDNCSDFLKPFSSSLIHQIRFHVRVSACDSWTTKSSSRMIFAQFSFLFFLHYPFLWPIKVYLKSCKSGGDVKRSKIHWNSHRSNFPFSIISFTHAKGLVKVLDSPEDISWERKLVFGGWTFSLTNSRRWKKWWESGGGRFTQSLLNVNHIIN